MVSRIKQQTIYFVNLLGSLLIQEAAELFMMTSKL